MGFGTIKLKSPFESPLAAWIKHLFVHFRTPNGTNPAGTAIQSAAFESGFLGVVIFPGAGRAKHLGQQGKLAVLDRIQHQVDAVIVHIECGAVNTGI